MVVSDAPIDISIEATDDNWGVKEVRLEIDGTDIGIADSTVPYVFPQASFPGNKIYSLVATATDHAGNVGRSAEVQIAVGNVEPPDPPVDDGGVEGSGTTGLLDDGDAGGGGAGCACNAGGPTGGPPSLLAFGLVVWVRRRRS